MGRSEPTTTKDSERAARVRDAASEYDAAFAEAYRTYYSRVFAFVYSRVGSVEQAKDLTAEIFERAYQKGHGLREIAAYPTWLFRIARNVVVSSYRKQKRESERLNRIKESPLHSQQPPGPEERAIDSEKISRLLAHLRTLSQRDQQLLSLRFEGGLSCPQIAELIGLSEVNVRVAIFRTLKKLRQRLIAEPGWLS